MEWIYEDGMYVTEMEFEAFFDRSQQKTTVRDKMVENGMRGCYGRRNKDKSEVRIWFQYFVFRIGFFLGGRRFSDSREKFFVPFV